MFSFPLLFFSCLFWIGASSLNSECKETLANFKPYVVNEGRFISYDWRTFWILEKNNTIREEISGLFPPELMPMLKTSPSTKTVLLDENVVVLPFTNHYYHFMWEVLLPIHLCRIHSIFETYGNVTILLHNDGFINDRTIEILSAFELQDFFRHRNILYTTTRQFYQVTPGHKMIIFGKTNVAMQGKVDGIRRAILFDLREKYVEEQRSGWAQLYLNRHGERRQVHNENEIFGILKELVPTVQSINPGNYPILKQKEIMSKASLIVNAHGTQLGGNMVYLNPNVRILELASTGKMNTQERGAKLLNITRFRYIWGTTIDNTMEGNFTVDPIEFRKALVNVLSLP